MWQQSQLKWQMSTILCILETSRFIDSMKNHAHKYSQMIYSLTFKGSLFYWYQINKHDKTRYL